MSRKRFSRKNKVISTTLDPMSLEKLKYCQDVIQRITGNKETSHSIIIRRAIDALLVHYDKMVASNKCFPGNEDEKELFQAVMLPTDYHVSYSINPAAPLRTFPKWLSGQLKVRAVKLRGEMERRMNRDLTSEEPSPGDNKWIHYG